MPSASKEANRYQAVEEMLGLLLTDPKKRFTRRKLFGTKHQGWQARILKELCETGVLKKGGQPNKPLYQVADMSALEALAEDEVQISGLAWPNSRRQALIEPDPPAEAPPPLELSEESGDDDASLEDPGKIAQITLKLLGAVMENLIYLREKTESMEAELHALRKDVKEWRELWE